MTPASSYMPIGGKYWPAWPPLRLMVLTAVAALEVVVPAESWRHAMGYGHAERNLALIRQLEAETRQLLNTLDQLDPEQSAWLQVVTSPESQAVHQCRPETLPQAIGW